MLFIFKFKTNYEKRSFKVPIQANETLVGAVINNVSEAMETLTRITEELVPVPGSVNGVNALGLVVFSMCFGFVIGNMKEQGQALREFFDSLNEAIMRLVAVIMWYVFPFSVYVIYEMVIAINMCSVLRKVPRVRMANCSDLTLVSTGKSMNLWASRGLEPICKPLLISLLPCFQTLSPPFTAVLMESHSSFLHFLSSFSFKT